MSWHCVGPGLVPSGLVGAVWLWYCLVISGSAWRRAALSAAVGAPLPPRASITWASRCSTVLFDSTYSSLSTWATNPPLALASATSFLCSAMSSGVSPCFGGSTRSWKIRGELTIAACSGCATGTLMTSIRNRAEFGSCDGIAATQPGSSLSERTCEEPEMYT